MKSPINYQNSINIFTKRGFMIVEIMIAFSIFVIFTISNLSLESSVDMLKTWSLKELDKMEILVRDFDSGLYEKISMYGNDTLVVSNTIFNLSKSDYIKAWGRDTCDRDLVFDVDKAKYYDGGIDIGLSNPSTDLEVRNDFVYLTTDSSIASYPDFYIIDNKNPFNPRIISSLNTGPGILAIDIAGPYVFVAQASTINQMQIIDIHDKTKPSIISQVRLPTPTSSTTLPIAKSIFYSKGYVYIGTTKWDGSEFFIIDVSNIKLPIPMGKFETNTLINDIYVDKDKVYLASSDEKQLRVLDVSDKQNPKLIDSFSPSGWQSQEGKVINLFEEQISFGRTVGGFNVVTNYELFGFSSSTGNLSKFYYKDFPSGVYGTLSRPQNNFVLTHQQGKEFQVFDPTYSSKIFELSISPQVTKMVCDGVNIYFATGNGKGFSILKL